MIPRERLFAALEKKTPDRLPAMELAIDWKVIKSLGFSGYFDAIENLDLDAVTANQLCYQIGHRRFTAKPGHTYKDQWGVTKRITQEILPIPIEHPVKDKRDLVQYKPPDPSRDLVLKALKKVTKRYKGKRAVLFLGGAVFVVSWNLCGMENLLSSYLLNPGFAKDLAQIAVEYNKELHRLAIEAGAEVVVLGDDYAHKLGPLMSPEQFREFILPGLSEIVRNIKTLGAYCIKHTDGNIWSIIDPIIETGIDGIGPLEPMAGMDLSEVKKRYGHKVCVVGNVDVDLLCRGSVEDIHKSTKELIDHVSPGGGHILSSGNSITSSVKAENFLAMIDTVKKHGSYPAKNTAK